MALVGEEQVAAQGVQALAFVQLATDPAAQLFVGDVPAQVDGAPEPAVLLQRPGEGVLPAAGVEFGDEQARGGTPGLHRPDEAEQTVPVIADEARLDRLGEQRAGVRVPGPPGAGPAPIR